MNRRVNFSIIILSIFLLVGLTGCSEKTETNTEQPDNTSGGKDVLMIINGDEITKEEYQLQLKLTELTFKRLQESKKMLEKQNDYPELQQQRLAEVNKRLEAGTELFTIGRIVIDNSLLKEAQKNGFEVSKDEAKQYSEQMKANYENSQEAPGRSELEEIIELFDDEDYYWNIYAPKVYQEQISIAKLRNSIEDKGEIGWEQYQRDLVRDAEIEIKDDAISFTKEDVLNYMSD